MKPKLSFEKILLVGTVFIALMMSATGLMVYLNGRRTTDGVEVIRHSYEVINGVEGLLLVVREAEASQRGYLLTGRETFLDAWEAAKAEVPTRLARLGRLVADDDGQATRVVHLGDTVSRRIGLLDKSLAPRRAGGAGSGSGPRALAPSDVDGGRKLMEQLRTEARALTDSEQARLDTRANVAESGFRATAGTLVALMVVMVGVVVFLSVVSWRFARLSRRSESELLALATKDELTGLNNRREFNRRLAEEVVRYERFPNPFSLVLLDIDHFKHVNDTYGHPGGDMVLRQIAAEILNTIRKIDLGARYGGEELALILPGLTREQAFTVTDRIRLKIAARPFESDVGGSAPARFSVTLSAGVVVCDGRPRTVDALIESADKALYAAKHGGRNRTVVAEAM